MPDQTPGGVSLSMTPYTGPWTKAEAAHLLRRTTFGHTYQQIMDAVSNGMSATVSALLQIPAIGEPLTFHPDEAVAAQGTSWVLSEYPTDPSQAQLTETARLLSLAGWTMERINNDNATIAEKMCLFWQNHFAVTAAPDSHATYQYLMLLRSHALGNFRQLVKDVTIDPAMLLFLNGATNSVYSPNENYARELLELFTIGKGPQIGPGDYTNYTEDDVAAGARILTGYSIKDFRSTTAGQPISFEYYPILHDNSNKTLSSHFNNATITGNGLNEYADFIDVIFQQDEVARFICRKLYRYFVNYDLTPAVEQNVITEMANTMIANNYEVLPVLTELFTSAHFYDISVRGALIRSPMDYFYGMFNTTESVPNPANTLQANYELHLSAYWITETLGQGYAAPPSVSGWPAYYQAPGYTQLWVNATHIKTRFDIGGLVTVLTGLPSTNGTPWKVDALTLLNGLSLPAGAPNVIDDLVDLFCPKGLDSLQKLILKAILTNNAMDSDWTNLYNDYLSTSDGTILTQRVNLVLYRMFQMPEFHTM